MFRIFIICVLALQVQSRPYFIFGKPLFVPWPMQQPIPQIQSSSSSSSFGPMLEGFRFQNSLVNPWRNFLSKQYLQSTFSASPMYSGRIEMQQPSFSPMATYGPPPSTSAASFAPSFEPTGPPATVYGPPSYSPSGYESSTNFQPPSYQPPIAFNQQQPQPPPPPPQQPPTSVYGPPPSPVYGIPPAPLNPIYNIPPNQFSPVNSIPSASFPPLSQSPFAPYPTNVLPLNPNFNIPGPGPTSAYLPPVPPTVNRFGDPTPNFDVPTATTPANSDSESDANDPSSQTVSSSTLPPNEGSTLTTPLASTMVVSTEPSDALRTTTQASDSASSTTTTAAAADATATATSSDETSSSSSTATIETRTGDINNNESSDGTTNADTTIESSTNGVTSSETSPATELANESETAAVTTTAANEPNADDSEVTTSNNEENNDESNAI